MTHWPFVAAIILGLVVVFFMWAAIVALWFMAGIAALYTGLLFGRARGDRKRHTPRGQKP